MYIVFEGIVGTGKTTQSKILLEHLKKKYPTKQVILTYEPGGTEISNVIRKVVQGTQFKEEMESICEAYLYGASRAQSLKSIVAPVLENNGIIISDRSFITSLAYQGFGRGLTLQDILAINETAIKKFIPDLILYFDLDVKEGLKRTKKDDKDRLQDDRWEAKDETFFEGVAQGYTQASKLPMFKNKWVNIDASGDADKVFENVLSAVKKILFL